MILIKLKYNEHNKKSIVLNLDRIEVLQSLQDKLNSVDNNYHLLLRLNNEKIRAEYIGASRIDGYPIYRVDETQITRSEKIKTIFAATPYGRMTKLINSNISQLYE